MLPKGMNLTSLVVMRSRATQGEVNGFRRGVDAEGKPGAGSLGHEVWPAFVPGPLTKSAQPGRSAGILPAYTVRVA